MTEREYHGICTAISTKDLQISQTIFIFAFFVKFNEKNREIIPHSKLFIDRKTHTDNYFLQNGRPNQRLRFLIWN